MALSDGLNNALGNIIDVKIMQETGMRFLLLASSLIGCAVLHNAMFNASYKVSCLYSVTLVTRRTTRAIA